MSSKIDVTGTLALFSETPIPPAPYARLVTSLSGIVEIAPITTNLKFRIQDATGASPPNFIEATIPAGTKFTAVIGTGSVPIAAGAIAYLRISQAPSGGNAASFLQAEFEHTANVETGIDTFASLAQLKSEAGITGSAEDADLTRILQAVTRAFQKYMARPILSTLYTNERHWINVPTRELYVFQDPIDPALVPSVTELGDALVAGTDFVVDYDRGRLYREDGWSRSEGETLITYRHGIVPTPSDLVEACIQQARLYRKGTKAGGDRLGDESRATEGVSSQYFTGATKLAAGAISSTGFLPSVTDVLNSYRRVF